MVYYPCLGTPYDDMLRDSMPPSKDVEGLCRAHKSSLHRGGQSKLNDGFLLQAAPGIVAQQLSLSPSPPPNSNLIKT